jgi:ubiquinone biosynthesis protein UbiJ
VAFGPDALGARALNQALDRAPWAREKLATHAGRRVMVHVGPVRAGFLIQVDGQVARLERGDLPADLHLRLSPLNVSSFLADPRRWNEFVTEEGDVALGGTLKELAQALPWFVEDTFARTFGDVLGTRLADVGRQLLSFPGHAAERLAGSATVYARDEANVLARGEDMRRFEAQSAALAERVRALDARLDALERGAPSAATFIDAGAAASTGGAASALAP